jgi:hypothetical protein
MKRFLILMNEADASGGAAAPAPITDAPAAQTQAPAADAAQAPAQKITEQPTLLTGEQKTTEEQAGADAQPAEGEAAKEGEGEQQQGAPEEYAEFTVPEGFELDQEVGAKFSEMARGLNLTQEQAQGLVGLQNELMQKYEDQRQESLTQALEAQRNRWADEIRNDPEVGGAQFDSTVQTAMKAMQAFGSDDLRQLLNESGIGNHPAVVKLFHKIGKGMSEDTMVQPGTQSSTERPEPRAADVLFPNIK